MNRLEPMSPEEINTMLPRRWHAGGSFFRGDRGWLVIRLGPSIAGVNVEVSLFGAGFFYTIWRD